MGCPVRDSIEQQIILQLMGKIVDLIIPQAMRISCEHQLPSMDPAQAHELDAIMAAAERELVK